MSVTVAAQALRQQVLVTRAQVASERRLSLLCDVSVAGVGVASCVGSAAVAAADEGSVALTVRATSRG